MPSTRPARPAPAREAAKPRPKATPAPRPPEPVKAPAVPAPSPPPPPPLPDRPAGTMRRVWLLRGVGLLIVPGVFLAWPLVLPIVFGLLELGLNMWIAHILAYVIVLGAGAAGIAVWSARSVRAVRFQFGPDALDVQRGVYVRQRITVPYAAIHEIHTRQGRLLRAHGLATVRLRYRSGVVGAPLWGEASLPGLQAPQQVVAFLRERVTRAGAPSTSVAPVSPSAR